LKPRIFWIIYHVERISKVKRNVLTWCKKLGGELLLFHCIPYESGQSFPFQFIPEENIKEAIEEKRESAEKIFKNLKMEFEKEGVPLSYEIKAGYIFLESLSAIRRLSPDVVLLTPEGGEFMPFFIGSNTLRILRDVDRDILFLKSKRVEVETVIFPVDLSRFALKCGRRAFEIAKIFNVPLEVINVLETKGLSLSQDVLKDSAIRVEENLQKKIEKDFGGFKDVKWNVHVISAESAISGIMDFLKERKNYLIVIGKKGYSLLQFITGNLVEKVARYSTGNVWIVSQPQKKIMK